MWKNRDLNGESGSGSPNVIPLPDRRLQHSALRISLSSRHRASCGCSQVRGVEAASNCFTLSRYSKIGMITRPVDFILISIAPAYIGYLSLQTDKKIS